MAQPSSSAARVLPGRVIGLLKRRDFVARRGPKTPRL